MSKANARGVHYANADAGRIDKKYEGYSNLKGKHDQQERKVARNAGKELSHGLEESLIENLQKQIVVMEHEIKLLKEREVDQKNKASGYETLLRDGIPLNEHFLALKNKFNNEKSFLDKNEQIMRDELLKEEINNKTKKNKILVHKEQNTQQNLKFNEDRK